MAKTPRLLYPLSPATAGQISWITAGTTLPTGWVALSTSATTSIIGAASTYPALWARYTSTTTTDPIYRANSTDLVVQKMYPMERRTKELTLTLTSTQTGWVTARAVGIFYADSNNVWRLKFNIKGTWTLGTIPSAIFSISNIASAPVRQSISAFLEESGIATRAVGGSFVEGSSTNVYVNVTGNTNVGNFSGDVELASEPTAYTVASNLEAPSMTPILKLYDDVGATMAGTGSGGGGGSVDISDEVTARQNADYTLQLNINSETTARQSADSTLLTAIYANTTDILEEIKEQLTDSIYSLVTPVVFKTDNTAFISGGSTNGSYSSSDLAFLYSGAGGIFESINLLDTNEFLNVSASNIQDVTQVDLQVFWKAGKIDTAASYYVSRDGGSNYSTLTMTQNGYGSGAYYATYKFLAEGSYASLVTQSSGASNMILDATNVQSYAQAFTLSAASTLKSQDLYITITGTPIGYLYVSWAKSSSSLPSDVLAISQAIDASTLSTGTLSVSMPETPLPAGTYFLVVSTNSVYRDHYVSAGHSVGLTYDAAINGGAKYNGTTWSDDATNGLKHTVKGRALDLRVKIVSSTSSVALMGFGIFYAPSTTNIISTNKKIQVFKFKSATANLSTFAVTSFVLDKDLCKVYWAESGLCLIYPGFQISGNSIVFPTNTFYDVSDVDVTLVVQQLEGSSFDNSDMNGALLTENHLGSITAGNDRSVTGKGIYLRNAAGVLRELALDSSDNIIIMDT